MSNKLAKTNKQYSVKEFCERYNSTNVQQTKDAYIQEILKPEYVPYEEKIAVCEKIIDISYYGKSRNNEKQLHVDSPAKYMVFWMNIIKKYTSLIVNLKENKVSGENILTDFNLLNQNNLINEICSKLPEREIKEWKMLLDMVESDVLQNEYETHAFIDKQITRLTDVLGVIVPIIKDKTLSDINNIDVKKVKQLFNNNK